MIVNMTKKLSHDCYFLTQTAPYGKEIPVQVHGNPKSGLKIDYTPYEVGECSSASTILVLLIVLGKVHMEQKGL